MIFILLFISPFIIKVKIECKSQFGNCPQQIVSLLSQYNYKSLFSVRNGVNKVMKNNFLLTDYSTQYKIPDILMINILVRKPDFVVYDKNSSESWLIDGDGTVLAKEQDSALPTVITAGQVPVPGSRVDDNTLAGLKLMQGVWEMYQVKSGNLENGSLAVDLPLNIQVIFPLEGDPQVLLGALRLIYAKVSSGDLSGKYRQINLRFKNPVLR